MSIRIMSFNTLHCENYKTGEIDFDIMADTIKNLGAEIIGLQEMRSEGESDDYTDQVKALSERTGYKYYYFAKAIDVGGKNDPYGNAILSKYPIISAKTAYIPVPLPPLKRGEVRCVLKAVVDVGYPLTVLVTHFGLLPHEQQNAVDTVIKLIEPEKCVLMGDFNVTPDDEVLLPINEKMVDCTSIFDEPKLSFPSDVPDRRIDYIYVSRDLKIENADIPPVVASDHRPFVCDIKI